MKQNKVKHTTIRNGDLLCNNCGVKGIIKVPISIHDMVKLIENFDRDHEACPATWVKPEPDLTKSVGERITFWLEQGEHGRSSETMFEILSGTKIRDGKPGSPPSDPDDFRRCYLLLKTIPEWLPHLKKMCDVSDVWEKLIYNWSELTRLLEANQYNKLYSLMKSLGC